MADRRPRDQDWLVVIDGQRIFADPTISAWGSPMWAQVAPRIRAAVRARLDQGRPVVFTRFVADPEPTGSWVPYYSQFPFAQVPDGDPLYDLVPELADLSVPVIAAPTFGKWVPALIDLVGPTPRLSLAGVSTDCCVLSTALAAADGGAFVRVAGELCAGSTTANHDRALAAMELYGPQIELV